MDLLLVLVDLTVIAFCSVLCSVLLVLLVFIVRSTDGD